jgi:alpha-ribazole phosphatase
MEIYLIRHTTPKVTKGICYGQTDLEVTDTFLHEASLIKKVLPDNFQAYYSSPLQRCSKLAATLFPNNTIIHHPHLKEINCGIWEMQHWDAIDKKDLDPFMNDFVNIPMPNGESYIDLYTRVTNYFSSISNDVLPAAIVSHGGVIRSILSYITNTPLQKSFDEFKLYYGCVVKLTKTAQGFNYSILHNIEPETSEQHKPSTLK